MTIENSGFLSPENKSGPQDEANTRLAKMIGECATGNERAFEEIYTTVSPQVFSILKRMLKSEALAEEALQESFIKIWNNAADYRATKSKPRTWLISIARNHAIDILRKRSLREDNELTVDTHAVDGFPENATPFDKQYENSEQLLLCLDELSTQARHCVVRSYCEGFSHEELSEQLQRPIGTIKSWIRRSLLSLKECLHGYA